MRVDQNLNTESDSKNKTDKDNEIFKNKKDYNVINENDKKDSEYKFDYRKIKDKSDINDKKDK